MAKKIVWEFTNQKTLSKEEFIEYIEKKVFKTIRKYNMLANCNKNMHLKKSNDLNTQVLKHILEKKFPVVFSKKPNISAENLSDASEDIFEQVLKGNFKNKKSTPLNKPLYFISDKELETYAKLKNIKGTKRKENKKIQDLFNTFFKTNPDLEINVVKAQEQILHSLK